MRIMSELFGSILHVRYVHSHWSLLIDHRTVQSGCQVPLSRSAPRYCRNLSIMVVSLATTHLNFERVSF